MSRPSVTVTPLQARAVGHIRWNAPIYPQQLAAAVGLPERAGRQLVDELVALGLVERLQPHVSGFDVCVISRLGMSAKLLSTGGV